MKFMTLTFVVVAVDKDSTKTDDALIDEYLKDPMVGYALGDVRFASVHRGVSAAAIAAGAESALVETEEWVTGRRRRNLP
jgi:hypothetical protein